MRKLVVFLIILILNLSGVISICENGHIDINNADATELDKLAGIGPAYASAIIDSRPFNSIDNLLDVKGIGPVTLEKIKTQGLACVEEEETQDDDNEEETNQEDDEKIKEEIVKENKKIINEITVPTITEEEIKTIVLNPTPKDIKSEIDKEELSKNKFAIYGLLTFGVLIAFLFVLKKWKNEKTEFR